MNLKLTDKTALVSGSTKGIGLAIATGLAREGARVIVNGRSDKAVAEAKLQIAREVPGARVEGFRRRPGNGSGDGVVDRTVFHRWTFW